MKLSEQIRNLIDKNFKMDDMTLEFLNQAYQHNRKKEEAEEKLIDDLKPKIKEKVYEHYRQGATLQTIADELGVSIGTIYKVLDNVPISRQTMLKIAENMAKLI